MASDGRYYPAVPLVRPFRALRYDQLRVPDLSAALCPPYDIIGPAQQQELLAQSEHNCVRLELPPEPPEGDWQDKYRTAARSLAAWRTDGTLRKDPRPHFYVHEMRYRGSDGKTQAARGFMARLRLEPLTPQSGVRRHERTMAGPKEDRFALLRATGANLSPIVLLHGQPDTGPLLDELSKGSPAAEAMDPAGVQHRLWLDCDEMTGARTALQALLTETPLTIADGHHRYETALRYQAERGRARACESDPPFDYVLALIYAVEEAPAVLPTHRLLHHVAAGTLLQDASRLFSVQPLDDPDALIAMLAAPAPSPAVARFGCWTNAGGAVLAVSRDEGWVSSDRELDARLDVAILAAALGHLTGIGADELTQGGRVTYTKDAHDAVSHVKTGAADACILLDPTPVREVLRVAQEGAVMPQKSSYFHPKAPTGLVFNPLEP